MNTKELRIGNYLNLKYPLTESSKFIRIGVLSIKKVNTLSVDKYEPILLSEEWHNKFGVIKNGFNNFEYKLKSIFNFNITVIFSDDYVMLRQGKEKKSYNDDMVVIWNKDLTKRDMYVHEWQNLYYSLTGKELTI